MTARNGSLKDVDGSGTVTAMAGRAARLAKDNANNVLGNDGKEFISTSYEEVSSDAIIEKWS